MQGLFYFRTLRNPILTPILTNTWAQTLRAHDDATIRYRFLVTKKNGLSPLANWAKPQDYRDDLTGPGCAWEYLRRNPLYRAKYSDILRARALGDFEQVRALESECRKKFRLLTDAVNPDLRPTEANQRAYLWIGNSVISVKKRGTACWKLSAHHVAIRFD